jgi:acetylornithine/succinyldiaminopimelate/putrescine aminotransferase
VIRLAPALNVTKAECDQALEVMHAAFASAPVIKL